MQEVLRWCASLLTILPGIVIAARVRPIWTGWAFVALTAGALTWITVASFAQDYALLAQNCHHGHQLRRHLPLADLEGKPVIGIIGVTRQVSAGRNSIAKTPSAALVSELLTVETRAVRA